ncbi:hypothetical protein SAMN05216555_10372 [Arthrobacter cupressi]|uniref:Ig-like domain (Group 3) n=1 Tax=Arthrobacter cupressi TaxID=1045773 RepID=A0A1G8LHZ4_9MICC|nr:hypothetical protein SAMN05216555_10372 [Arthrobacter cupressi]
MELSAACQNAPGRPGTLRRTGRRAAAALATGALLLGAAGIARADNIYNNLDGSVDSVAEVMPLNAGGANGVTVLAVQPTGGDGKPGCNLTAATTLTLSLTSSQPSVATVSPSSVTFTACGDTKQVTVTPLSQGSTIVSAAVTSNNTGGTFNLAPATFQVNVAPPAPTNTAPTLGITGVSAGSSYSKGAVPAAVCNVTDTEDGPSTFPATLGAVTGPDAATGVGSQTASCDYTDDGGLHAAASLSYNIVDATAPGISYTLSPVAPDGLNGWYRSEVYLDWTVTEGDSPSTLALTGCTDQLVSVDQVSADYSCAASSSGGSAAQQTVSIKKDGTAPGVEYTSASGTEGNNGWYTSDVTATFTGTDATSGPASATQTATSSGEGSDVVVQSPAFTDNAGNETAAGAASHSFKVDKTAPGVEYTSATGTEGNNGWYTSDVTATFTGTDATSGPASATQTAASSGEGSAVVVESPAFSDNAGNVTAAGAASHSFKIDKTAPSVAYTSASGTLGDNGWYTSDVTATFTGTDATSGPASATQTATSTGEGSDVAVASPAFSDEAGNVTAAGADSRSFKVDKTNPTATFDSLVGNAYFGSVAAAPSCTASDDVSGPAGCVVTGYSTQVGTHTLTATATDNAGRTSTTQHSYTVMAWTLKGFYQPVDMNGVLNTVKGGSTVPAKFEVFAGSTELTDTNVVTMSATKITCTLSTVDDIELTATGNTSLRYDSVSGQFIYNWKTPTTPGSCYRLTMKTADGSSIFANFKMK